MTRGKWIALIAGVVLVDVVGIAVIVGAALRAAHSGSPLAMLLGDPGAKAPEGQRLADVLAAQVAAGKPVHTQREYHEALANLRLQTVGSDNHWNGNAR